MKTREKILLTSLNLFNQAGEPNVTTLDISTEMNISPGNLYYHFKGKDALVLELFQRFESEMVELQVQELESESALLDMWMYVQFSFEAMSRYLFLFRDVSDLLSRYRGIQRRFNNLLKRQRKSLAFLSSALVEERLLLASSADVAHLVEHMTMTMTFWPNYQRIQSPQMDKYIPDLTQCAYQVMTILLPYLEQQSQLEVRAFAEDYR